MTAVTKSVGWVLVAMLWIGCGDGTGTNGGPAVWTTQVVESGVATRSVAVALDSVGEPHIAFLDSMSGQVFYASLSGDTWSAEAVPGVNCGDEEVALALDAADHPHLAFQCDNGVSPGGIRYAHHDGSAWQVETVESSAVGARYPSVSIAVNSAGAPAITYYAGDMASSLQYATRSGSGTWSAVSPDPTQYAGFHGTSLAFDASDEPVLSYYVYSTDELRLARFDGATWTSEVIDSGAGAGQWSTLRLDAAGRPHIVYLDGIGEVKFQFDEQGWLSGWVGRGTAASLALGADGTPWVAIAESPGSWIEVGSYTGGAWSLEKVPQISTDWEVALAIGATGTQHLVWDDDSTGSAMYAKR